jgi:hypothetical protein
MAYVATSAQVLAKVAQQGWEREEADDGPASFCFKKDGQKMFVPKPPDGVGYSDELLSIIARTLESCGAVLWPLDHWMN